MTRLNKKQILIRLRVHNGVAMQYMGTLESDDPLLDNKIIYEDIIITTNPHKTHRYWYFDYDNKFENFDKLIEYYEKLH